MISKSNTEPNRKLKEIKCVRCGKVELRRYPAKYCLDCDGYMHRTHKRKEPKHEN